MRPNSILFLFISSIILAFSSCSGSGFTSDMESKIIGTWEFTEVKFRPDGKAFYSDYSNGFQGSSVTFKEGGILEAYDKDLDTLATGNWYIDYYEEYDSDGDTKTTIYYMVGTLDIPSQNIFTDLLWDELSISKNKLNAVEKDYKGGDYKYKMVR